MSSLSTPSQLDTLSFPLHGARLIEASAGTGKTFTIAGLYLRLLLGHGDDQTKHANPLSVEQILVVTFTEAATAELRDRIRQRIHSARLAFSRGESSDPVIAPLLQQTDDHDLAARLLLQAERQMDQASIFTIHGFCQRMLTQHAFESGSRFQHEFVTDETELKQLVVADFWRSQFYHLPLPLIKQVRDNWATPYELAKEISGFLSGPLPQFLGDYQDQELTQAYQSNLESLAALKKQWLANVEDIASCIANSDVSKRSYSKTSLPKWIAAVSAWAEQPTEGLAVPDELKKFSQSELLAKTAKGQAPELPIFVAIESLTERPASIKPIILARAIKDCRERLAKAKQRQHWLSFDDLLGHLATALNNPQGETLAQRIREQYPVAMIDEFQDTDPLQYQIFQKVYLQHPDCGWFMIGDPKQAIYGFRGADIFTYIQARNQVSAHYTLSTNWRSTSDMVSAVNDVFSQASSPFMYDDDIPFYPVNARPNGEQSYWQQNGQRQAALEFWLDEEQELTSKTQYQVAMAEACANHIHRILALSQQGEIELVADSKPHSVKPSNIAVLVRTGSEAKLVKEQLARQGIASVYLSNRDSVFQSEVATELTRIMPAVMHPEDESKVRAAMASSLFNYPLDQLFHFFENEAEWDAIVNRFKQLRVTWLQRGVQPMLRLLLNQFSLAQTLLSSHFGERGMTDFLHLSELLQQASQTLESPTALIRWLSDAILQAETGNSDEAIQRLESERDLVKVITIHKSKGLEYDLVYLPFAFNYREANQAKFFDSDAKQTYLDIEQQPESIQLADNERLAEDLRLIYVALTRAVYGCFIGAAPLSPRRKTGFSAAHLSAIGYLIQNGEQAEASALGEGLNKLSATSAAGSNILVTDLPLPPEQAWVPETNQNETIEANEFRGDIDSNWRMSSYSSLVKQSPHGKGLDVEFEVPGLDLESAPESELEELQQQPEQNIFTFPRGATPGTFLHSVFEEVHYQESGSSEANTEILVSLMDKAQIDESWLPTLQTLVDTVLSTPLDGKNLCLKGKRPNELLVEMEFLLPIQVLEALHVNQVTHKYDALSSQAGELEFRTVQGMLKGFIDLVFVHQGKYYVLDWKSNHLGNDLTDYDTTKLSNAMIEHRYDLQYQIYTLALHRFLKTRIPDYQYQTHFGGVFYAFLRGMNGESQQGVFATKPKQELVMALDRLIDGLPAIEDESGQMELLG